MLKCNESFPVSTKAGDMLDLVSTYRYYNLLISSAVQQSLEEII